MQGRQEELISEPTITAIMKSLHNRYVRELLSTENKHLRKLNEIVMESVEKEKILLQSIAEPKYEKLTSGQRIADRVAKFGGSWKFIIAFSVILMAWIIVNMSLPALDRFDPFPFILLNLLLSCLAAVQAPIIMMSQNRQEEKDRQQNENDYLVNLKSEIEIRTLHEKIDLLIQEQFKELMDTQAEQIRLLQQLITQEKRGGSI